MDSPQFTAEEIGSVEIAGHVTGKVALLHWLQVPSGSRRRGLWSAAYRAWEAKLPATVRPVRLFAADSEGSGNSDAFWDALGFGYVYRGEEGMDYEAQHQMHKGVNGGRTPPPR